HTYPLSLHVALPIYKLPDQDAGQKRQRSGEYQREHRKSVQVASDLWNVPQFLDDLGGPSREVAAQPFALLHRAPKFLERRQPFLDRKSTRLNSSHVS